jgi:hypothetical protein
VAGVSFFNKEILMLGQKLLAFPELKAAKGIHLSRRHIDRMEANGDFPVRVKVGEPNREHAEPNVISLATRLDKDARLNVAKTAEAQNAPPEPGQSSTAAYYEWVSRTRNPWGPIGGGKRSIKISIS